MRTTAFLGKVMRATLIQRSGMSFDSRHHAPNVPARDVVSLYLVGRMTTSTSTTEGPQLWALREDELERRSPDARWFRSEGDPFSVVNIVAPRALVSAPLGIDAGPRALPAGLEAALGRLAGARKPSESATAFAAVWSELITNGLARQAQGERWRIEDEPAHVLRLWRGVDALYRASNLGESVEALASVAGLSVRQLRRDHADIEDRLGIGGSFRATSRILRVRRAVLLLSASDLPLTRVAHGAGYGSLSAMGRAFRDLGLMAPIEVRGARRGR
jgi:AraC-like DNA-binding protein